MSQTSDSSSYSHALSLLQAGNWRQAQEVCEALLERMPLRGEYWQLRGVIAYQTGRHQDAIDSMRRAVELGLCTAEIYNNLAAAYDAAGLLDEAVASCRTATQRDPRHFHSWRNLAFFLQRQRNYPEAEVACRRAIELSPNSATAYNTLGNILQDQSRFDEAINCYRRSFAIDPKYLKALSNLGNALSYQGSLDEALSTYEQVLQLEPSYSDPHFHRAMLWLLKGDFDRGWPEYEWRWRNRQFASRQVAGPRWDGSPLPSGSLLIHAEQGLGDTLQFVRYLPLLKKRVKTVVFECPSPLRSLLAGGPPVDCLVTPGDPLPAYDAQLPLLSIPRVLGTRMETIPCEVPYLVADCELVERWRGVLAGFSGFRIGIAWQGNPGHPKDSWRSIALKHFAPLAGVPGVRLISLQKQAGAEQLAHVEGQFRVVDLGERVDQSGAFVDTAAIMRNLDLVISSDTAIAHLAGGLGVPTWVALPLIPDWRWLLNREDSPWYPSMRLFRQRSWGNWDEVFQRMARQLESQRR